jgi:hypothetical protein
MAMNCIKKISASIIIIFIIVAFCCACDHCDIDATTIPTDEIIPTTNEPTQNVTQPIEPPYTMDDNGEKLYFGIPASMFEQAKSNEFQFTIKDLNSNKECVFGDGVSIKELPFEFYEEPASGEVEIIPDPLLAPSDTALSVQTTDDSYNNIFVFGVLNNSDSDQPIANSRIIYVSYTGNAEWEICGVTTEQDRDAVINVFGKPTQEYESDLGYSMEWYVLHGEHVYLINTIFNSDTQLVEKIIVSIDNHPIYAGNYIPED